MAQPDTYEAVLRDMTQLRSDMGDVNVRQHPLKPNIFEGWKSRLEALEERMRRLNDALLARTG